MNGFVTRPGRGSVEKEMEFGGVTLTAGQAAPHEDLPDERGDGHDGARHGEESGQRQACVRQACANALTNGPDLRFGRQSRKRLDRLIGYYIIKLAYQPLV